MCLGTAEVVPVTKAETRNDKAAFERCVDFMVKMFEKYGPMFEPVTIEMIREKFGETQCKRK